MKSINMDELVYWKYENIARAMGIDVTTLWRLCKKSKYKFMQIDHTVFLPKIHLLDLILRLDRFANSQSLVDICRVFGYNSRDIEIKFDPNRYWTKEECEQERDKWEARLRIRKLKRSPQNSLSITRKFSRARMQISSFRLKKTLQNTHSSSRISNTAQ